MSDDENQGLSENWATLWEAFADAQPDHTAVVIGTQTQTWRELDDRAARLASALEQRGAGVTRGARARGQHQRLFLETGQRVEPCAHRITMA